MKECPGAPVLRHDFVPKRSMQVTLRRDAADSSTPKGTNWGRHWRVPMPRPPPPPPLRPPLPEAHTGAPAWAVADVASKYGRASPLPPASSRSPLAKTGQISA